MTGNSPLTTITTDVGLHVKLLRMPFTTVFTIYPVFGLKSRSFVRQRESPTSLPCDRGHGVFLKFGQRLLESITLRFYCYVTYAVGIFFTNISFLAPFIVTFVRFPEKKLKKKITTIITKMRRDVTEKLLPVECYYCTRLWSSLRAFYLLFFLRFDDESFERLLCRFSVV